MLKGIGILEVVIHHTLGFAGRKYADHGSWEWWAMRVANRILHFAVPLFLFVSAALLTASLMKRLDWQRFVKRRAGRTLWPYLLWSAIYVGFRLAVLRVGNDVETVSLAYPVVGTLTGPRLLVDVPDLVRSLLWGKAYYHLYFMSILLQMALVLPFAILAARRTNLGFGATVLAGLALQLAMFLLQWAVLRFASPASLILWYLPSVLTGVWLGMNRDRWPEVWDRNRRWIVPAAAASLALYLAVEISLETGRHASSLALNSSFVLYTLSVSLLLLGMGPAIERSRFGPFLASLGQISLPVFLIHPMVLYFLGGPTINRILGSLPFSLAWTIAIVLGVSVAFARLVLRARLDTTMFGQQYRLYRLDARP
ncbi:MAG TPA: acyltransferase [Fimbriimonas sp.]